jgi:hypothetical protein
LVDLKDLGEAALDEELDVVQGRVKYDFLRARFLHSWGNFDHREIDQS